MRVLIASDKFKDSLSAREACQSIAQGIKLARPDAQIRQLPVTDGGDGFARIMTEHAGGAWHQTPAMGPLQQPLLAGWGWQAQLKHAWLDCAEVIGLRLLAPRDRNPLYTTSYGLGQLIKHIAKQYTPRLITLGLGGSSTHDVGCGLAVALGYRFLDKQGRSLVPTGASLSQITRIVPPDTALELNLLVATDVNNPLLGPQGAAYTFAQQKGAQPRDLGILEQGTQLLVSHLSTLKPQLMPDSPGSGAAGGLGFGLQAFVGARLISGVEKVQQTLKLDQHLQWADYLLTGEGCFDSSSLQGKITGYLLELSRQKGLAGAVFCGHSLIQGTLPYSVIPISLQNYTLEENLRRAPGLLTEAARQWAAGQ